MEILFVFSVMSMMYSAFALSKWEETIKLYDTVPEAMLVSHYTDPKTNITFALIHREVEFVPTVGVQKIFPNKTIGDFIPIMIMNTNYYRSNDKITGTDDGKHLFIVTTAWELSEEGMRAEVYFSESNDNGISWSKPVKIQRENMDDIYERETQSLVYVKETGRIYIFYLYHKIRESLTFIGIVTRPAGSTIFSTEKLYFTNIDYLIYAVKCAYTLENSRTRLHLIMHVSKDGENLIQYSSSDDGFSWTEPKKILNFYAANSVFVDVHPNPISKIIHMIYPNTYSTSTMISSYDNGNTWKPENIIENRLIYYSAYCAPKIFFVTKDKKSPYDFMLFSYDDQTKELKEHDTLNVNGLMSFSLYCTNHKLEYEVTAMFTTKAVNSFDKSTFYSRNINEGSLLTMK